MDKKILTILFGTLGVGILLQFILIHLLNKKSKKKPKEEQLDDTSYDSNLLQESKQQTITNMNKTQNNINLYNSYPKDEFDLNELRAKLTWDTYSTWINIYNNGIKLGLTSEDLHDTGLGYKLRMKDILKRIKNAEEILKNDYSIEG